MTETDYKTYLNDLDTNARKKYETLYALRTLERGAVPVNGVLSDLEEAILSAEGSGMTQRRTRMRWLFFPSDRYELTDRGNDYLRSERTRIGTALDEVKWLPKQEREPKLRELGYDPADIAVRKLILDGEFDAVPAGYFKEPRLGSRLEKRLERSRSSRGRMTTRETSDDYDPILWQAYGDASPHGGSDSGFHSGGGSFGGAGASSAWDPSPAPETHHDHGGSSHHTPSGLGDNSPSHSSCSSHSDSGSGHHSCSSSSCSSHSCSSSSCSSSSCGSSCGGGGCGGN